MLPEQAGGDCENCRFMAAEFSGHRSTSVDRAPAHVPTPDFSRNIVRQLSLAVPGATALPALRHHIGHVVVMRSEHQMRRVHAFPIVAFMQNVFSASITEVERPRKVVSLA